MSTSKWIQNWRIVLYPPKWTCISKGLSAHKFDNKPLYDAEKDSLLPKHLHFRASWNHFPSQAAFLRLWVRDISYKKKDGIIHKVNFKKANNHVDCIFWTIPSTRKGSVLNGKEIQGWLSSLFHVHLSPFVPNVKAPSSSRVFSTKYFLLAFSNLSHSVPFNPAKFL